MAKPIVYVARRLPDVAVRMLSGECEIRQHQGELPPTRDELLAGVARCTGILSLLSDRIDAEVMDAAGPQLKVISNFAVGYNNIDIEEARRRGIAVGNTPDVLTDATADIAIALLLAVARRLPQAAADARQGRWKTWEPLGWLGIDLQDRTLGIVGMGRIGAATAQRMHGGWGTRILYTSRQPKPEVDARFNARHVPLETLLEQSDFVSLHVPLDGSTRHLIGREQLRRMQRHSILINTARGEIVDQDALYEALRQGQIFGAGLDVTTPEPLPPDHPLYQLDNCLILPHIGSATDKARNAMAERAAANLLAGMRGQPLPFPVVQPPVEAGPSTERNGG
ncbi:MAG: D-glycerate dehydrogenase [Planctomycetota bacterium]|nr:MAG: D-glycerate dehydrogenase [Planctomycetota bacterium]